MNRSAGESIGKSVIAVLNWAENRPDRSDVSSLVVDHRIKSVGELLDGKSKNQGKLRTLRDGNSSWNCFENWLEPGDRDRRSDRVPERSQKCSKRARQNRSFVT